MKCVAISFIILFLHSICFSQDVNSMSNMDSLSLETIIISTSRAQNRDPVTFQNIGIDEIEKINIGQDPVILIEQLSPSIITYSDGGSDIGNYSQLRLRGMDQSRINITLNGVPLNDMVDHGVYFSNFSDFGNSVQSIQIQRGAGVTNRGVASYGGAINFESINLFNNTPEGEVQVTFGSFGTLRTAAELSTGLRDDRYGFYGRFTRTETDGFKYNSGSNSYSMFFSGGKIGKKEMIKITAFSGKTQNGQSYEHVLLQDILNDPRTNNNDHNDIDDFTQNMVQVQYARNGNHDFNYNFTAYYNGADGVFPYSFGGDQYMYGLTNNHYGAMFNITKDMSKGKISGGIHSYLFDRTNFEYITPFASQPYTRDFTDKSEFSAFLKYNSDLNTLNWYGSIELRTIAMDMSGDKSLGVNLDIANNWTFFNSHLGVNYDINSKSALYVSLANTNREPTRSDINNGVKIAESVTDLELGWKYKTLPFRLATNLFFMTFSDEITKVGALQERSYIEIRQNVDKSIRAGVEIHMEYEINHKFSTILNASYMKTNIDKYTSGSTEYKDVKHLFTPNWVVQPKVNYRFSKIGGLSFSSRYVSDSFTELSNDIDFILPSHFIVNAQLDLAIGKRLNLSFLLNNVFDTLYFTEGAPVDHDYDGIVEGVGYRIQPPRNFNLFARFAL